MHERVAPHIATLDGLLHRLLACQAMSVSDLPASVSGSGIYLFSENGTHLYVGRTDNLRQRLQQHQRESSNHNAAVFAFRLAREQTGLTQATYRREGSRAHIEQDPVFAEAFRAAKVRIRAMHVRTANVSDPVTQALFEVYAAVALATPYNSFENH
jgi:hypothetical protein